ncbi:MAG: hypothetical protein ABRQ38_09535 [Candidatus Eremiobacterota bacterium]
MLRPMLNILFIVLILYICLIQVKAGDLKPITLDPINILEQDQIDMALDNNQVNVTAVKQGDVLYVDSSFFSTSFKLSDDQINSYAPYGGTLKLGTKDILCLPLLSVLKSLGIRYTYNPIYSKDIVRIRTDRDFKVDPAYSYKPSDSNSHGNLPDKNNRSLQSDPYYSSLYTGIYSTNRGRGYYYPPGYTPGYYFGSYGFVPQVTSPVIYDIPSIDIDSIDF